MALQTSPEAPAPLRQISQLVAQYVGRLGAVWVEGEIAQLNRRRGVSFLTLRDVDAQISMSLTCHSAVLDGANPPVTEGARVVVHAKPDFYAPSGTFSLRAREIRPVGIGQLLAQIEKLRQLLAAEGLFDTARKRPLPFLPGCVGLVTGRDSAAERDVLDNARLRWPGVEFQVEHALMQGQSAARQVADAVARLDASASVDVIVVARGGGSVEDLLPFSNEGLVRAVASATTPVVSAIGHEPDTPLLDLVADLRASTPTDAAKRVVPAVVEELERIATVRERSANAVRALLRHEEAGLRAIRSRPSLAAPMTLVDERAKLVEDHRDRARRSLHHRLERAHDEIGHQLARVRGLSPLSTLARGYAVAQHPDGTLVTSVDQVRPDDDVHLRVVDGHVRLRTLSTERTERSDLLDPPTTPEEHDDE